VPGWCQHRANPGLSELSGVGHRVLRIRVYVIRVGVGYYVEHYVERHEQLDNSQRLHGGRRNVSHTLIHKYPD